MTTSDNNALLMLKSTWDSWIYVGKLCLGALTFLLLCPVWAWTLLIDLSSHTYLDSWRTVRLLKWCTVGEPSIVRKLLFLGITTWLTLIYSPALDIIRTLL